MQIQRITLRIHTQNKVLSPVVDSMTLKLQSAKLKINKILLIINKL